jgi:hypothetical protein
MKSTVGFILALIGGILGILSAVVVLFMGAGLATLIPLFGTMGIAYGVWMLVMSVLAIFAGLWMNKPDNAKVKKGGIMALIVGILGFNLLTIIGGIVGLVQANK